MNRCPGNTPAKGARQETAGLVKEERGEERRGEKRGKERGERKNKREGKRWEKEER